MASALLYQNELLKNSCSYLEAGHSLRLNILVRGKLTGFVMESLNSTTCLMLWAKLCINDLKCLKTKILKHKNAFMKISASDALLLLCYIMIYIIHFVSFVANNSI